MRALRIYALFVALVGLIGCTAAQTTYHLVDAEVAMNRAKAYGADTLAVYEYTMAVRYLEKAREENGYADYGMAVELARISAEWADGAIIFIDKRGLKVGDAAASPEGSGYVVPRPGSSR